MASQSSLCAGAFAVTALAVTLAQYLRHRQTKCCTTVSTTTAATATSTGSKSSSSKSSKRSGGGISKAVRKRIAKALLAHSKAAWKERVAEHDLVAPYSKASAPAIEAILNKLALKASDCLVDLGCGDARWLIAACQKFGCRGIGYEIDPKVAAEARSLVKAAHLQDSIRVAEEDLFTADVSEATHVVIFLSIEGADKLATRLRTALQPGTVVCCYGFKLRRWPIVDTLPPRLAKLPVYIYKAGST